MDVIDRLLENNRAFAETFGSAELPAPPRLAVAIVTCMDCRIDPLRVLGLQPGDAHVVRNAGGAVTEDVIRSLAISQRKLGTRAVMLIHHSRCGMSGLSEDSFRAELQAATGMAPSFAIEGFADVEDDVRQSLRRVRSSPFLLHTDQVRGFVYEVESGLVREVAESA